MPSPPSPSPQPEPTITSSQGPSQSWTSWILDSYATSVNPYDSTPAEAYPHEDDLQSERRISSTYSSQHTSSSNSHPIAISISPTDLPTPPTPSSPGPFSSFTKTGRGGAGNFLYNSHNSNGLSSDTHTNGASATAAQSPTQHHHLYHHHHHHHRRQSSLTSRQKAAALIELLPLSAKDNENGHGRPAPPSLFDIGRSSTFPAPYADTENTTSAVTGRVSYRRKQPPASLTFSASPTIPSHPSFVPRSPLRSVTMSVQTSVGNATTSSPKPSPSLFQTANTSSSTDPAKISPITTTSKPPSSTTKIKGFGRGGAGNYAAASGIVDRTSYMQTQAQRVENHKIAAHTRLKVEEEVDGVLKRPGGAYVGEGREREREIVGGGEGMGMG